MSESTNDNSSEGPASSLADWRPGATGRVVALAGDAEVRRRLLEMGLTPGAGVRVIRVAPLGDPMELAVRGYRLSIRRSEARCVTAMRDGDLPSSPTIGAAAGGR